MTGPDVHRHDDGDAEHGAGARDGAGAASSTRDPDPPEFPTSDAQGPMVPCPPFRPDTVSLGPFDEEPFELQPITWQTPSGNLRPAPELQRCLTEWLTGALDAAGVAMGAFDRLQVHLIATDGWGPVQTVAGWITRAREAEPPGLAADSAGASAESGPDPPGTNPPRNS